MRNYNEMIKHLKNRKEEGLINFMEEFTPLIYNLALNISKDKLTSEEIENITSETIVEIVNSIDNYNENTNFKSWVFYISRKYILENEKIKLTNSGFSVSEENKVKLMKFLIGLEDLDKKIFYCKYFYYLDAEEISLTLKVTIEEINKSLNRSKELLNQSLL